jgi:heat shock protein beta
VDSDGDGIPDYLDRNISECLVVYNEFSPNGDGVNDYFIINCIENYRNNRLQIFNRQGLLVFETANYKNNWNGYSNRLGANRQNKPLPEGTYFYILDLGSGSRVLKGWLYINR